MYLRLGDFPVEVTTAILGWVAEGDINSLDDFRRVSPRFSDIVSSWTAMTWASSVLTPGMVVNAGLASYLLHRPWVLSKLRTPVMIVGLTSEYYGVSRGQRYEWSLAAAADLVALLHLHNCPDYSTKCGVFKGLRSLSGSLTGLQGDELVCPASVRGCESIEGSRYLQALAERQILPRVILGGFKEEHLMIALENDGYSLVSDPKLLDLVKTTRGESNRHPGCFKMMLRDL